MKIRFLPIFPTSIVYGGQEIVQEILINELRTQQPNWEIGVIDFSSREPLPDIYHLVGNAPSLAQILEFIPPHIPIVLSAIHGVRKDSFFKRNIKKSLSRVSRIFYERTTYRDLAQIFHRANKVLPTSPRASSFIQSRYGISLDRIEILPNGASTSFFNREEVQELGVLISGTFISRKRIKEAVEFALSPYGQKYTFHFIGGLQNNELDYGNDCIKRLRDASNCHYHGFISHDSEAFWRVFDHCRYFLQLSDEETQSLSALEAIAGGKRCVFRKADYSLEEPFSLFPRISKVTPEEIGAALDQAEARPFQRATISSWQELVKRLVKIYEELLA